MPKYILIGLGVSIIVFFTMHLWSKMSEKAKNKAITSIFGVIAIGFVALASIVDKIMLKGTKFQVKVWKYLKTIPKGKVKTYKQVAIGINRPKSARAVANACAKNPYAPKVPCHRVIRSDGSLGGYSAPGGLKTKKKLLKKEGFLL